MKLCSSVNCSSDEDIVISGISGKLPESANIEEFKQQLFDGFDMVTDDERRWPRNWYGLPARTGKIKDLTSFDAGFFGVHPKQANVMDPLLRMLHELTYESIVDAGINPTDLRGSRTGVFLGVPNSDSDEYWSDNPEKIEDGYGMTGCNRAMFPNRLSYTFDFTGPSLAIDTACSTSLYAMHQALTAMRTGQCDAAIVGGASLLLKPTTSLQLNSMSLLSPDGACKAFDSSANGYVRSDGVVVMLLQKFGVAKRVYATVVSSKVTADGYKDRGIVFPSGIKQNQLLREVYEELGVNPAEIDYVETHGAGTKVGDPQEVNSIAEVFCTIDRKSPLLLGSVKTNMGHAEGASGICSVVKVLIAMETGIIPPNLHFKTPNPEIPSLSDARIKVVTEATPWNGGLIGINNFGFGGANVHIVLKSNSKPKITFSNYFVPKMVVVSGRTKEAVNGLLDQIGSKKGDNELISLIHSIHSKNISGHFYRGYHIFNDNNFVREVAELEQNHARRPIWYVIPGLGSEYAGMGRELTCIPTYRNSLRRCAEALESFGIDLMDLINNSTKKTFDNVLNVFVCTASIQVALVDLLALLGIKPDGIIGHSFGELACAYADGCFTLEQTVLAAYWRGVALKESKSTDKMGMAVIGLSWQEAKKRCPLDVFPACHNSNDCVTISGPVVSLDEFIAKLQAENVFAKTLHSFGALHTKYIAHAGPKLLENLQKLIPKPKQRSSKWISTSVPESDWNDSLVQLSSPEYHVNNFLSPVLFKEGLAYIPQNAVVIEIAPHGVLQAILKRSLPPTVTNVPLQKSYHSNNVQFFLCSIGKLYNSGLHPQVSQMYPLVSFPVGRGTPMINSMIKWDHSAQWDVADFMKTYSRSGESVVEVDLTKETYADLSKSTVGGRVIFPASGYLTIVWGLFAKMRKVEMEKIPVVFDSVKFLKATVIEKEPIKFYINILNGTGNFEVREGSSVVVTGKIQVPENLEIYCLNLFSPPALKGPEYLALKTEDVYKDLRLRGYTYSGKFQGIVTTDNRAITGKLSWFKDWTAFIDTMIQFNSLGTGTRDLRVPSELGQVMIDPINHKNFIEKLGEEEIVSVYSYPEVGVVKCGGVQLRGIKTTVAPQSQQIETVPKHEMYTFFPYENSRLFNENLETSKLHALSVLLQIVKENLNDYNIKAVEVTGHKDLENLMFPIVLDIFQNQPLFSIDLLLASAVPILKNEAFLERWDIQTIFKNAVLEPVGEDLNLILAANILTNNETAALENLSNSIKQDCFIILEETGSFSLNHSNKVGLTLIGKQIVPGISYILLKKIKKNSKSIIVHIMENTFSWLETVKTALISAEIKRKRVIFLSQGEELLGLVGFINCIQKEAGHIDVSYFFIQDKNVPKFSMTENFYVDQLNKQLSANVFKNGQWGSYRHLRLNEKNIVQASHAYANTLVEGDLSSLSWIQGPLNHQPDQFSVKQVCSVYYAPLNLRDALLVTGKYNAETQPADFLSQDWTLGYEFSGRDSKGHRVMGLVPDKALATAVLADPDFLWDVPDKWTLEEASTIPLVYAISYYCLRIRGAVKSGENVLIHGGTGGVGQASISIALHMGCQVFTTVSTSEHRDDLQKLFPQLRKEHIGYFCDGSIEQRIFVETKGRGVDLILNSPSNEKQSDPCAGCLAPGGRFLELSKKELSKNSAISMSSFMKHRTFYGIMMEEMFESDRVVKKQLVELLKEGIRNGEIRPFTTTVFGEHQLEQAFRLTASCKYTGRVLVKIRDEEPEKLIQPSYKTVAAVLRTYMNPGKSYITVGGLGGLGLEIINWMIARGARNFVIVSRSGVRTGYQSLCMRRWREVENVNISVLTEDVTTISGIESIVNCASRLAPVGGIFNLAGLLKDGLIQNLKEEDFEITALPKVTATKHLDRVSRKLCPALDYFVVFSSISCGRGVPGLSNYGFANSAMERICEQRQSLGLPGLAIQWSAIGDVGLYTEVMGLEDKEVNGTVPQSLKSFLSTLDVFLQQPHPVLSSMVLPNRSKIADSQNRQGLLETVAKILGIKDVETVNPSVSLADFGMDSLMGTEIKLMLERNYNVSLNYSEIFKLDFGQLRKLVTEK